jgi:phage tail-like protein
MALVSFRLRRTDNNGSLVRGESRTDNSIRSDGYVVASSDTGLSTFDATVFNVSKQVVNNTNVYTSTLRLTWTLETPLEDSPAVTAPIGLEIVYNLYGEPLTIEDGVSVFTCNLATYVETVDHITASIKPGSWVYYGFFIKYSDGTNVWYERAVTNYVQIPTQYGSIDSMWQRVPEYYRALDQSDADNHLYRFLELFGWELDKLRSLIDSLSTINDPLVSITPSLDLLAKQLGIPHSSVELGTNRLRTVLLNAFELRKRKGTRLGTAGYISALSGCATTYNDVTKTFKAYTQRVNLLSDPKFRQQNIIYNLGTPASIERNALILRTTDQDATLRDIDSISNAIRNYSSTTPPNYTTYTTNLTTSTAASVGWGVYTSGYVFSSSASVPVLQNIVYNGEDVPFNSIPVVLSDGNGISITIPEDVNGPQTVVVYGRKPFMYHTSLPYYTSFNCNLSSASFANMRFMTYDTIINDIEQPIPEAIDEAFFYDSWNNTSASNQGLYTLGMDVQYNNTNPAEATSGRFGLALPLPDGGVYANKVVVPALLFSVDPGESIVISEWLVEPLGLGKYFDGDTVTGGFIQAANQSSAIGLSDYRWGASGGQNNQDFSYYTLDYGRVTSIVESMLDEHIVPVTMIGDYTLNWDVIPGD